MILVDTNVVSETMRQVPDAGVVSWLDAQMAQSLYLSAISLGELMAGIAIMPEGRRKADLSASLSGPAMAFFGPRVLPFDARAASSFAVVMQRARSAGRPIGIADAQIAAIALANGLAVATRDVGAFEGVGVTVVNPWLA